MSDDWEEVKTPEMTFTAGRGKFMDGGNERTVGGSTYGGSTYGNNQSSNDNNNGDGGSTYGGGTDNVNGGSSYGRGGGSSYGNQASSYGNNDNEQNDGDEGGSYRGGGRGRGRGRGRGGSRGGRRDDDENRNGESSWGGGDEGDGERGQRGGRGRGGRGRGRGGGRGGGRGDDGDGDDRPSYARNKDGDGDGEGEEGGEPQKPRELYIPPEPSNEDSDIFGGGITSGINFSQYDKIQVKVSGENCPKPIASFENCGLRSLVLENIKKSGYTIPTPIQKYTTPIIMAGRDVMGCAQTGSGKTASFLIPIINSLLSDPTDLVVTGEHTEPQCIIVAPTRELAQQIRDEARKFARSSILKVVLVYGGTGVRYQLEAVEGGAHILVGTPGRLQDFIGRGKITFSSLRFMVLDEADRMLDLGFGPEIEKMMTHQTMVPAGERQTLMFSATFPEEIQQGAAKYLSDYIFIAVGILGGACSDVEQLFYQVTKFEKKNKLKEMLESADKNEGTLVFVETKRNADFIAALLSEAHLPTTSIHGDRLQREREEALRDFKSGSKKVLVATAVAARGLDIKNVAHVINYDLPKTIDEYVHRIGRTGRVGNKGKATSFYDDSQDTALAGDLMRILKDAGQAIPDWLSESPSGGSYSNSNYGGSDIRRDNTQGGGPAVQEEEEEW